MNIIEIFILNHWFMQYLLNLFRRSNFACCLQVFRPKCITTFSGFQSAAVQLLHWFLAKWSSVWDGHLMRCIPVVRGCWFRWWCYSSHFEQAHCRYHIQCNYSLCSSLSWGGPVSCRCWSVEWSPGHLLTQSSPCWCRTRSRRREDCDRFRSYVPELHQNAGKHAWKWSSLRFDAVCVSELCAGRASNSLGVVHNSDA